jgi:hypothetical protein
MVEIFWVLGIDGATWRVVNPNLDRLKFFRKLIRVGKSKEIQLDEKPLSPSIWCGMFSGKFPEEHKHLSFTDGNRILKRENIKVEFIWDLLEEIGKKVRAVNVPFVVPPYSFNTTYNSPGFGLPMTPEEWQLELDGLTSKIRDLLDEGPELLISIYTLLDRVQHFHWGEPTVLEWYRKLDCKLEKLFLERGFWDELSDGTSKLILISDHGFCSFGEAKVQTLPKTTPHRELKGDHEEKAMLISANVDYEINKPQDVFHAIRKHFKF